MGTKIVVVNPDDSSFFYSGVINSICWLIALGSDNLSVILILYEKNF